MKTEKPKEGSLRVWWIPQIPMKAFNVDVSSVKEAVKILNILTEYDAFQYMNKIKPDYCNAGGLGIFEDDEWIEWYDPETGENINEVMRKERQV